MSNTTDYERFMYASRQTFLQWFNTKKYKNGAFDGAVNDTTHPLESCRLLLDSPLLTEEEKSIVRTAQQVYMEVENDKTTGKLQESAPVYWVMKGMPLMKLADHFKDDAASRGLYVPPTSMYVMDENNKVTRSIAVNRFGNSTEMEGGQIGHVPGAPDEFNRRNVAHMQESYPELGNHIKSKEGKEETGKATGNAETVDQKSEDSKDIEEEEYDEEEEVDEDPDPKDFGAAFSRNLRGAFI